MKTIDLNVSFARTTGINSKISDDVKVVLWDDYRMRWDILIRHPIQNDTENII